jgi:hypothetical protein
MACDPHTMLDMEALVTILGNKQMEHYWHPPHSRLNGHECTEGATIVRESTPSILEPLGNAQTDSEKLTAQTAAHEHCPPET